MSKRILIFGLPGSGKTTFAAKLKSIIPHALHLNADAVRTMFNDWDFSDDGRLRQAHRMRDLADIAEVDVVILDFVCPRKIYRDIVDADIAFFMDTIASGRFEDTNSIFEHPVDESVIRIK